MAIIRTMVVNIRYSAYDVDITRKGPWGNPFLISSSRTRRQSIKKHYNWLLWWTQHKREIIINGRSNKWIIEHLEDLRGKRIGCHCAPKPCHGDNYIKLLRNRWIGK